MALQRRSPSATENPMDMQRPDPNAELYSREPLRIVFALSALILGLVATLNF
jgi:hypothetical protein